MSVAVFIFQVSSPLLSPAGRRDILVPSRGRRDIPVPPRAPAVELNLQAAFSDRGLCQLSLYRNEFLAPFCHIEEGLRDPARAVRRFELLKERLLMRLNGEPLDMKWSEFDLRGNPAFHVRVWKALHGIPFGTTATYGQVAKAAGSPRAARACGQACGANPILLFIPCHRVVSSTGLGGFGCGLEWKKRFLALEGVDWRRL